MGRELEDSKSANEVLNGISAELSEKLQQANDALAALKLELNEKESVNKLLLKDLEYANKKEDQSKEPLPQSRHENHENHSEEQPDINAIFTRFNSLNDQLQEANNTIASLREELLDSNHANSITAKDVQQLQVDLQRVSDEKNVTESTL